MVIPAGSCLVALSPDDPVQVMGDVVAGVGEQVEQSFDLGDGERDQPDVLGGCWSEWSGRTGCGPRDFSAAAVTAQTARAAMVSTMWRSTAV